MAAVHVAHDVLDRGERHVNVRCIMHRQDDAGDDLQGQAERQYDAPDPPPVQVLWCWDHQCVIKQAYDGQALVQPFSPADFGS